MFNTDENSNIIISPVMGWSTAVLADRAILLAIHYPRAPLDEECAGKSVQFCLTPEKALEFGQTLARLANLLIGSTPP